MPCCQGADCLLPQSGEGFWGKGLSECERILTDESLGAREPGTGVLKVIRHCTPPITMVSKHDAAPLPAVCDMLQIRVVQHNCSATQELMRQSGLPRANPCAMMHSA